MKKILAFVISILLALPVMVWAKNYNITCSEDEIVSMQEDIKNVKLKIELLPEGSVIKSIYTDDIDISYMFKVSTTDLPSNYNIKLYPTKDRTNSYLVSNDVYSAINDGGVYIVDFYNSKCPRTIIKTYELMIPYFNKDNEKNVWFDGTYSIKDKKNDILSSSQFNVRLLITLIVLIIVVVISILLLKKKKKSSKLDLLMMLLFTTFSLAISNDVKALEYAIDSNGETAYSSGGGGGSAESGNWLVTGVGVKFSLVNIKTMESVSDFVILNSKNIEGGSKYSSWYNIAKNTIMAEGGGLYGKIGATYSYNVPTKYSCTSVDGQNREDKEHTLLYKNCIILDGNDLFLSAGSDNAPNVDANLLTNRLFVKTGENIYKPRSGSSLEWSYFHLFLTNLLIDANGLALSEIKDYIKNYGNNHLDVATSEAINKPQFYDTLNNYRIVVEPIYISGKIQTINGNTGIYWYGLYTIKAAFNALDDGNVKISSPYYNSFYNNFYANGVHGLINKDGEDKLDIKKAVSGYGYIIYGIVDENPVCDPKTKCCFNKKGEYNRYSDGIFTAGKYSCPSGIVIDGHCSTQVVECVSNECPDKVEPAVCEYEGDYTKATFHENDNLAKCTIGQNNNSGFAIVSKEESLDYCEVSCKDDIDILLPTAKKALNGSYFKLNQYFVNDLEQYTPEIKTTRSCVTTKINYSQFNKDLTEIEKELIEAYNEWQDWISINGDIDVPLYSQGASIINGPNAVGSGTCYCEGKPCGSYVQYEWTINKSKGRNGTEYSEHTGSYKESMQCGTKDNSKDVYYSSLFLALKSAEMRYRDVLKKYVDTINAYNKCYGWTKNTQSFSFINNANEEYNKCALRKDLNKYTECVEELTRSTSRSASSSSSSTPETRYYYNAVVSSAHESVRKSYDYTFKPDVTFNYKEDGKNYYPTEYKYNYDKDVSYRDENDNLHKYNEYNEQSILPITETTYWLSDSDKSPNDYYKSGDRIDYATSVNRGLIKCNGTSCSTLNNTIKTIGGASTLENIFFYNNKYILRTESYNYMYHLPILSTMIPNGIVNKKGNYNQYDTPYDIKTNTNEILLVENDNFISAAPVNIKTKSGIYDYSITIDNFIYKGLTPNGNSGDIRYRRQVANPDDNFETRYNGSNVISGNGEESNIYLCEYEVINDIYSPGETNPEKGKNLFFYRPVEITNINPLGRQLGYNWNDSRANIVKKDMYVTGNNYQVLTNGKNDKFEFTLTPSALSAIRKYNTTNNYSQFTLTCTNTMSDNYHCNSKFLECLASLSNVASKANLCNNILEGRNLGTETDYGYDEFINNREILIKKQASLKNKG